ncbi:MAG: choline-sulfatase [Gammaproteobacteria bacterium]|nr:choline-sulfatase [Gammaproteobacteria bacterium]
MRPDVARQPNILMIMADQMAPQVLPAYGHALVKTPHIDALAERGVVFENAYCNFPLCVPSRASMLTGRYANSIAVWDNAAEMTASTPTLAHYLRGAGYSATLCGKMHFIGPDQLHGFGERLTTDIYPSNFAWTPDWTEGDRPTGISMRAVIEAGRCVRSLQIDYDDEVEYHGGQKLYDLARFAGDQPWFLLVSFTHPHSPFITTDRYWDLYRHEDIERPAVAPIALEHLDPFSRWLYFAHAQDRHTVTEEHVRNARHAYYGMVSYIDDKVGHLLSVLEATGLADSTAVVFTADHGEMLGERGMWYKQTFFEWSARVPFIISGPGIAAGRREAAPVSLVDLLPTLHDLATDAAPLPEVAPLDGHSLAPLLGTAAVKHRWEHPVISEYTGEGTCSPCRMIRRGALKCIYTHGHPLQLFDLANDPLELDDKANAPAYAGRRDTLAAQLLDGWDAQDVEARARANQAQRHFIQKVTGGAPTWAFEARPGDTERYVRNASAVATKGKARLPYVPPTPFEY